MVSSSGADQRAVLVFSAGILPYASVSNDGPKNMSHHLVGKPEPDRLQASWLK
jgi:hypothetical protein